MKSWWRNRLSTQAFLATLISKCSLQGASASWAWGGDSNFVNSFFKKYTLSMFRGTTLLLNLCSSCRLCQAIIILSSSGSARIKKRRHLNTGQSLDFSLLPWRSRTFGFSLCLIYRGVLIFLCVSEYMCKLLKFRREKETYERSGWGKLLLQCERRLEARTYAVAFDIWLQTKFSLACHSPG